MLATVFVELGVCPLDAGYAKRQERRRKKEESEDERQLERTRWIDYVRSNEITLRANRASPRLLHQIAGGVHGSAC